MATYYHFGALIIFFVIVYSKCQVEYKKGVKIEMIVPPTPGCYGVNFGDFYLSYDNMTLTDGTPIFSTHWPNGLHVPGRWYLGNQMNGINIGLRGMCKGEKRNLTIPPHLMYGSENTTVNLVQIIPGNSTILYQVEMLDVVPKAEKSLLLDFISADWNADWFVDSEEIDRVLTREKSLRRLLRMSLGMDNMVELAIQWFDKDGDGMLNRLEYFEMSEMIGLEQLRKDANAGLKDKHDTVAHITDSHNEADSYLYDTEFGFIVGSKKVPVGLSRGVMGMCVGEIREINVPPHLGYGEDGKDKVPGGSWLLYEVELVEVSEEDIDVFETLDEDKDEHLNTDEMKKYFSLPNVVELFGDMASDENSVAFLTQTIMNMGDTNGDDVISREEFYAIEDFQKLQQKEKEENEIEFRDELYKGEPISFAMGSGQLLKGIEQGVDGMCVGEKRRVTAPPALAYGSKGTGDVPGGATVILEIEVLTIKDQLDVIDQFHRMDINKDGALDFKEIEEVVSGEQFQKMMPVKMDDSMRLMMIQTLFTMSDKNRDGQLDPSEFTHMSKMGANAMKKKMASDEL
ncbi:peptidyl-prolyl cis-trans isomerase FKBP10-like [Saccostrea echinata]|uniref:peptidyl-prolyl cis-trans isomerase FKBP10-like n=1 Tax=Saccostrea echinata TaxID=191078 RepID=UPI002A83BB78|nr:peptidyl-prolyl cis-trans isomerase FKBP10-like [Saccostrea echinata]